MKSDKLS